MKSKFKAPRKGKPKKPTAGWITYTYSMPKGKLANRAKEHLQAETDKKNKQRRDLRDIAIYLSGMLKGKGDISPLSTTHIDSLWEVAMSLR
jgi:hypothetical protein